MLGKHNIFSGILTVIVIAVVIFLGVYFLFPNVAMKYFGVAADTGKMMSSSVEKFVDKASYLTEEEKTAIEDYVSSADGQKILKELSSAATKGGEALKSVVQSQEFRDFASKMKSSVSAEKIDRLMSDITSVAESLFSKVSK